MRVGSPVIFLLFIAQVALGAGPPDVRPLTERDNAHLRLFLKGVPGDWRNQTAMERGLPEPAAIKTAPEGVSRYPLIAPGRWAPRPMTLADAIAQRRSHRDFSGHPVTLESLSFLLWHTQGITGTNGQTLRAAPSAGARFPLETYVVALHVEDLAAGLYRYDPGGHQLIEVRRDATLRAQIQRACFDAPLIGKAALVVAFTTLPARTEWKYGPIAHRMIAFEAGHAAQNLCLGATAAGLGACPLASYHQPTMDQLLEIDGNEEFTLYLVALGHVPAEPPTAGGAP